LSDDDIQKLKDEADRYLSMKVKQAAAEKLFEAASMLGDRDEPGEAIKLLVQAVKLYEEDKKEKTPDFFEKSAVIFDKLKDPKLAAEAYLKATRLYVNTGDRRAAIPVYLKAAEEFIKANMIGKGADSLRSASEEYAKLGEQILAAEHFEKSAETRLQIKDLDGILQDLNAATAIYQRVGRFDDSAKCLKRAAEVLVQSSNRKDAEAYYVAAAGDLQKAAKESGKSGEREKITDSLLEAASIYQKGGAFREAASCHTQVADEYLKNEKTEEAAQNYRRAAIERMLAGELGIVRSIVDGVRNEKVRNAASFRQALSLLEAFEKSDEQALNGLLKEINDYSLVRLCLAFARSR
jgi:tetratricopeptide (TPR) repeat protein